MKKSILIIAMVLLFIPFEIVAQLHLGNLFAMSDTNNGDWTAQHVVLYNTPEADMMVRAGDIDNVSFGWPTGFDPFSGQSTPSHGYPWTPDTTDVMGTDRIMVITSYVGTPPCGKDGYTSYTSRPENSTRPIRLTYSLSGMEVTSAALQIFVDDFQAPVWCADYFVTMNGQDMPSLALTINNLVQTGPIGKMVTYVFPPNQLQLLMNDSLSIFFDDTTSGAGDGYAIDFVKLLLNLKGFAYTGTINGTILDFNSGLPIENARVVVQGFNEVLTDADGNYEMTEVTAGIHYLQATKFGYDTASTIVDLVAGQTVQRDFTIKEVLDAEFSASQLSGSPPLTVQFTDLSTQSPNSWHWDFGDGDTSVLQNPEHTYAMDGFYTVKLTASNGIETNTEIKTDYIQVGPFGIEEATDKIDIRVFPNPCRDDLRITVDGYTIDEVIIYTLTGQESLRMRSDGKSIDVSSLQPGVYIVEVIADELRVRRKLVVH
ncbi:MAG: PKD domain-containing protein [Bacteroidales bacterium]|jgi:hypothetical protein|nr:PKD domain-containing protein [Bacteroidales bacterium]